MKNILLIAALIFSFTNTINGQEEKETFNLTIEFSGMKSDKGNLYIALYNSETSFLNINYKGDLAIIKNKKAVVTFKNLPKGVYAVSAFHDVNENKKMDTNFFGIPKEPIGISNDATGFMGPPKYKDAKFNVTKDTTLTITVE